MIGRLSGTLAEAMQDAIIIDVGGIGYEVKVSPDVLSQLPQLDEPIVLYIHHSQREDRVELFGFHTLTDREFFRMLITVSGVGPKIATVIVGSLGSAALQKAVIANDFQALTQAPGVGKKIAQRILLDLQDKIDKLLDVAPDGLLQSDNPRDIIEAEVKMALKTLGYGTSDINTMTENALARLAEEDFDSALLLRESLKYKQSKTAQKTG